MLSSIVFHYEVGPWSILPGGPDVTLTDPDGELTIPVEAIAMEGPKDPTPPPTANTAAAPPTALPNVIGPGIADASAPDHFVPRHDAGALGTDLDGGASDAEQTTTGSDASIGGEGGATTPDGGADAGTGPAAGPNNISVTVNMAVIRAQPAGANLGPIFGAIPQWKQFMAGSTIDPLRDTDWVYVVGPSLAHTEKDAVYVHYSIDDAVVEHYIDLTSKTYAKGGTLNVGVKGVKAWKGFADGAERAFIRPRPHLALIVPSPNAHDFAAFSASTEMKPPIGAGEAARLRAIWPGRSINIVPQTISEMRLWVVPNASTGGADLYAEGDCPDATQAATDAASLKQTFSQMNSFAVRMLTSGALNNLEVTSDGSLVKAHVPLTREQIDAFIALGAQRLGVTLPTPAGSGGAAPDPSAPR